MSEGMTAEQRLAQRGLLIQEQDLGRMDEPDITGFIRLMPVDEGADINLLVQLGTSDEDRETIAEWAEQRIERFFEHGPEPDGWQHRKTDGGWQLWLRKVWMPRLD